ncbi:DNA-processing protein DprA [Leucobacter sp. HNU]|uniref:DNA-processing protein DprA n=1 Tax=Leucobacter sp. HNU TaxID=3236805 RepID=UPI003A803327
MTAPDNRTQGQPPAAPGPVIADLELRRALRALHPGVRAAPAASKDDSGADEARIARVAWSRILEPGDGTAGALIHAVGASNALKLLLAGASPEQLGQAWREADPQAEPRGRVLHAAIERWKPRLDRSATLADLGRAAETGLRVVFPEDDTWPQQLNDLGPHAPVMLWVRGDPDVLGLQSLAIVGARAATSYGTRITAELTSGVCFAGAAIVSGAAYGIDAAAHRAALAAGSPTVAVLAGGAERPYPLGNSDLIDQIAERGAVCSEVVPGTAPTRWRFLQRNRLVAALSSATLVTEAGMRSGSLNTAGHAAQLGRALGAVPGPITSAASAGCHRLIREYCASLVTSPSDACELVGLDLAFEAQGSGRGMRGGALDGGSSSHGNADGPRRTPVMHQRILDAIPLRGARELEPIVRLAGVAPGEAREALAELELLGLIEKRERAGEHPHQWGFRRVEREQRR